MAEACRAHGIEHTVTHVASGDVEASAKLLEVYLQAMPGRNVCTFQDLLRLKNYKFLTSLSREPLPPASPAHVPSLKRFKPRSPCAALEAVERMEAAKRIQASRLAIGAYWDALTAAIVDLDVTEKEIVSLELIKRLHELRDEQVRVLHARAFTSAITRYVDDEWLDDEEREKLGRLYQCLDRLGWAPGS